MKKSLRFASAALALTLAAGCAMPAFAAGKSSFSKSETGYAVMNGDGSIKSTTVSEHLYSASGLANVTDKTTLTDIQNPESDAEFTQNGNTVWAPGEIWAKGLVNGKGNVNSSEMTTVPKGYHLKVVGDYYYDGGSELRVRIVKDDTKTGGWVNVVYYCKEDNTVWAPGQIWAEGLVDGKGTINCTEMTTVPAGYRLKVVGDYYYDGTGDFRVQIVKK